MEWFLRKLWNNKLGFLPQSSYKSKKKEGKQCKSTRERKKIETQCFRKKSLIKILSLCVRKLTRYYCLENKVMDPGISCSVSERSTIWANSTQYICHAKFVTAAAETNRFKESQCFVQTGNTDLKVHGNIKLIQALKLGSAHCVFQILVLWFSQLSLLLNKGDKLHF